MLGLCLGLFYCVFSRLKSIRYGLSISARIEEVPMNQNRFRNDAKYSKEIEYVYYLIFSNVCQINSILGKRAKGSGSVEQ